MNRQLQQAFLFCSQKTQQEAKNFYYAFLFLPKKKRQAIYVAYTFARVCDDIVDEPSPNKEEQLQQLRLGLTKVYQNDFIPTEPLFLALQNVVRRFSIPKNYFETLIDGMEMDLHRNRYQNFSELYEYCYKVAAVVGLICIHIFRFQSEQCLPFAVDLGIAMQLTNILRDIAEDARLNRIYLPLDELAQFQITEEMIFQGNPNPQQFSKFLDFQLIRAQTYFARSRKLLPFLEKDARICPKILRNLYEEILRKIWVSQYNVLQQKIRLSKVKKLLLMASTLIDLPYLNPSARKSSLAQASSRMKKK
ncbi:MAG: phytoene/squalene synthase family protein [Planctomycetota bacterium]